MIKKKRWKIEKTIVVVGGNQLNFEDKDGTGNILEAVAGMKQWINVVKSISDNLMLSDPPQPHPTDAHSLVDRTALWSKMFAEGVNGEMLNLVYNVYSKAKSCVRYDNRLSGYFSCNIR